MVLEAGVFGMGEGYASLVVVYGRFNVTDYNLERQQQAKFDIDALMIKQLINL